MATFDGGMRQILHVLEALLRRRGIGVVCARPLCISVSALFVCISRCPHVVAACGDL